MRMRRLGVVVAFDRVGHRLAHGMAGLNATQETASVIWRFRADKRDQFRVDCAAIEKVCYSTEIINKIDELFVP